MKLAKLELSLILTVAMLCLGAGPATQPVNPPAGRGHPRAPVAGEPTPPPTPQEWDELLGFMQINSPNMGRDLRDEKLQNSAAGFNLIRQWRAYKLVLENNITGVPDLQIKRFRIEDDVYALVKQARQDPSKRAAIQAQLHDMAKELVDLEINERQLRIAKLESLLAAEQLSLKSETDGKDALIESRAAQLMGRIGPAGRRGGGGPGRNPPQKNPPGNGDKPDSTTNPAGNAPGGGTPEGRAADADGQVVAKAQAAPLNANAPLNADAAGHASADLKYVLAIANDADADLELPPINGQ